MGSSLLVAVGWVGIRVETRIYIHKVCDVFLGGGVVFDHWCRLCCGCGRTWY